MYLIFGVLTTLVDYIAAMVCFEIAGIGEIMSNNIAWAVSVIFAYVTNKLFVFESKSFQPQVLAGEIAGFLSARIVTLLLADLIIWAAIKLQVNFLTAKIISSVFVVAANYIFSKLIIFKKTSQEEI